LFNLLECRVVQRQNSNWRSGKYAVAAGSIATSRQACATQQLDLNTLELVLPLHIEKGNRGGTEQNINANDPVLTWKEDQFELFLVPVLICKSPGKTVGLGDTISTVALLHQMYNSN